MNKEYLILLAVGVPLAGALLLPLIGYISSRLRNICALIFALVPFVISLKLIPAMQSGAVLTLNYSLPLGLNFSFSADCLAVFMAGVSSLISAIIVLYSFGYISHYENQNEYYLMVELFLGAMMGLVFSANLILMYIFWEITAITSWRLIGFFRDKPFVLRADKAFLVTAFGAAAMLIGFIIIYQQVGSFDLAAVKAAFVSGQLSGIAVICILFGILSKSATLPFHTWLPDAGVAPSPVTALLHAAVLVKIGVYVFARIFVATIPLAESWPTAVAVIAAISTLVAAGAALVETDLKRIIAYSTISQIGYIFFGFAIGSPVGVAGSLLYILTHGLAKAGLFLCAGIVEQNTRTKNINQMGGLIYTMPVTAIAFLVCSLSVMGIPPFGGFFAKFMIFSAAAAGGQFWIGGAFLAAAVMTILYLFRMFSLVFLGNVHLPAAKEKSPVMVFSVALLAFLSLASGLAIYFPGYFARVAAFQMLGVAK
jgi:NADH:ubiquinone oxidoreductase subunit 5 (subunit L)/multisubunit Na+/H+ antiporter MnhA subunit